MENFILKKTNKLSWKNGICFAEPKKKRVEGELAPQD